VAALVLSATALICNFAIPAEKYEMFADTGIITVDCTKFNSKWVAHSALIRTFGFIALIAILAAFCLGFVVTGVRPCKFAKRWSTRRRRQLLIGWVVVLLVSTVALCLFQLYQSKSFTLSALQGSSSTGCSSVRVFIANPWKAIETFVVGMAVSQYLAGLQDVAMHFVNNKKNLNELESAALAVKQEVVQDSVGLEKHAPSYLAAVMPPQENVANAKAKQGAEQGIGQVAAKAVAEASSWLESMNTSDLRADAHSSIVEGRSHSDACCHGGMFSCGSSDSSKLRAQDKLV